MTRALSSDYRAHSGYLHVFLEWKQHTGYCKRLNHLSADIDDVDSNLSSPRSTPSTLSSTAGFLDDPDYGSPAEEELEEGQPSTQARRITPHILKQQGSRPSQRILEMFAKLVESRMESCEQVTNMVKRYHRDRNLQMQRVV